MKKKTVRSPKSEGERLDRDLGRLASLVREFSKRTVLVVGDVGIDRYTTGTVERISPEAPVPIVLVTSESHKLGLAANCADNIHALGGRCELVGVVGDDPYAAEFRKMLRREGLVDRSLVVDPRRRTIVKERVVSDRQQLVRIDYETPSVISPSVEARILARAKSLIRSRKVDAVILQDYAKGMLPKRLAHEIIRAARAARKPVLVDPNAKSPLDLYSGSTFMTPNLKEAERLSGVEIQDAASLEKAGSRLLKGTGSPYVVITRGKDGMAVFRKGERRPVLIPTYAREVYDVSGAGDTVISVMALAYASGATIEEAAFLGNIGAGIVVGKRGTATVSPEEILASLRAVLGAA